MIKKTTNLYSFKKFNKPKPQEVEKRKKGEKKNTFRYITILKAARRVRNITKKQAQEGQRTYFQKKCKPKVIRTTSLKY